MYNPYKEVARALINAEKNYGEKDAASFRESTHTAFAQIKEILGTLFPSPDYTRVTVILSVIEAPDSFEHNLIDSKSGHAVSNIDLLASVNNGARAVFGAGGRWSANRKTIHYSTDMLYIFQTMLEGQHFVEAVESVFAYPSITVKLMPKQYKDVDSIVEEYRREIEAEEEKSYGNTFPRKTLDC